MNEAERKAYLKGFELGTRVTVGQTLGKLAKIAAALLDNGRKDDANVLNEAVQTMLDDANPAKGRN